MAQQGLKTCDGNQQQYNELLEDFQQLSFYKIMNELHNNILDLTYPRIVINAATLQKAFNLIYAIESEKIAEELQQAAMDSNAISTIESYIVLLDEAKIIQEQLAKVLNKSPPYGAINFEKQEKSIRSRHADIIPLDKPITRRKTPGCVVNCGIF